MSDERLEKLRRYFENDRFVSHSDIEIAEVGDDYAVTAADVLPCHLNAEGAVQGGMIYTLADFAFAVLANSLHPTTVTQSAHVSSIRRRKDGADHGDGEGDRTRGAQLHSRSHSARRRGQERSACANFNGFVSSKE